jgi:hypothetical protein
LRWPSAVSAPSASLQPSKPGAGPSSEASASDQTADLDGKACIGEVSRIDDEHHLRPLRSTTARRSRALALGASPSAASVIAFFEEKLTRAHLRLTFSMQGH